MSAVPETLNLSLLARQYVANGWALVPIPAGKKGPTAKGWNRRENCVTSAAMCARIRGNVGLAHAFSRTCVLDFDDIAKGEMWLADHGLSFDGLWNDPSAVRISSGRPNRGKLLFKLPAHIELLRTHQLPDHGLELRCASSRGTTMQDVLPPSIHPDTGHPYEWDYAEPLLGDWRMPPELPADVLAVWLGLSARVETVAGEPGEGDIEAARVVLAEFDPDVSYPEWFEIGAALHHEFDGGAEGLELWDEWSSEGSKYNGIEDLEKHWITMDADRDGAKSTLDSLRAEVRRRPISPAEFDALVNDPEETEIPVKTGTATDDFEDISGSEDPLPAPKKKSSFVFQTVDEFLNRKPPSWIIKGLLPRAALGVIYGDSTAGKTFVAIDQAMAIARGVEWRGHKTTQGSVAYIVAEGASGFQERLRAYCQVHGVDRRALPLRILAAAPDLMDNKKDSPGGVLALARSLKALGPLSVIYVDTYARVMGAGNENEAKDTNAVVANCARLHELTGAIVVLIHHSGKDSQRGARGSGALRAAADFEYAVTKAGSMRTFQVTKMKDGEDGRICRFKLDVVTIGMDEEGEDRTSCVVEHLPDGTTTAEQMEAAPVKPTSEVRQRILDQLATYLTGEVPTEEFIQDVRKITPIPHSGVENPSWKALITRPLKKLIDAGLVIESNGMLSLPKITCD